LFEAVRESPKLPADEEGKKSFLEYEESYPKQISLLEEE
jgi:hypothetical protein